MTRTPGRIAFGASYHGPARRFFEPMPSEEDIDATWSSYDQSTRDTWEHVATTVIAHHDQSGVERQLLEREAELRFLAARYQRDRDAGWLPSRCTGTSSNALAWFGVSMRGVPERHEYPRDASDLAACERTFLMAPKHVQERMLPVLRSYRAAVASKAQEVSGWH